MRLSSSPRARQLPELAERRAIGLAEGRQPLAILGRALACRVEEVVAHEDAGEVIVGTQLTELGLHFLVVRVQLVELRVDLLRAS